MMIKQYDTILLKDGRTGVVVEVFGEKDFIVDVGSSPEDWETIDVLLTDIEKVLKS